MNEGLKNKIRNSIHFDSERTNNDVNCYAYAVGIDLKENEICNYAFNPGQIGTYLTYYDNANKYYSMCAYLLSKPISERIGYDMQALDIDFNLSDEDELSDYYDEDGYYNWLIALYQEKPRFLTPSDIHFLRKTKEGYWVHKMGRDGIATNLDPNGEIITTLPKSLVFGPKKVYTNPSVYKLRLK